MTTPSALDGPTQDFLKALASETRQRIMMLFAGGAELTVGEVADRCGLGQSTTSEQLAILRRGGLVQSTRHGKLVHYRADPASIAARLTDLQGYLACCCPSGGLAQAGLPGADDGLGPVGDLELGEDR